MLSALKKKLGTSNTQQQTNGVSTDTSKMPTGVNVVSAELQKKFAHGVNYNMKIIIRGDRNSGKTCLWKRIQGKPFTEEYNPTDEIQATNIVWNYRASDFIVKIDVWDVVDESPKRKLKSEGLKLNNVEEYETPACDAGFVDVYKNCNGVLMIFDITKPWTWNYVERELPKVPSHIPVLIMSNKIDLEQQRQVREDDVKYFLSNFKRNEPLPGKIIAHIRYTQSSMKNAYGLKYLYSFLNIPFLFLQRETLERMLEANKRDIELSYQEMDYTDTNKDDSYDSYTQNIEGTQNHAFNTETKKAALMDRPQKEEQPVNMVANTSSPRLRNDSSSSEGGSNRMVDMFEEDFDSNDDDVHLDIYSKKADMLQPEVDRPSRLSVKSPVSVSSGTSDIRKNSKISSHSVSLSVEGPIPSKNVETLAAPVKGPSIDLDSWLETSPEHETVNLASLRMESSDEDEGVNPLVAPKEGESDEDESSDANDNEKVSIRSVEGSVSAGSSMGFTVLKTEQTLEKPKLKSSKKSNDDVSRKKKKKTDNSGEKKPKKKKVKKTGQSDLLVEDMVSPIDVDQYETL